MNSQQAFFEEHGYVIVEKLFSDAECSELAGAASKLVNDFDPNETRSIFSTTEPDGKRDAYFLDSGDKIRFFWEKDALADDGSLLLPKERAINKIGHALHDRHPTFAQFSRHPQLKELAAQLGLKDLLLLQSMYIFKHPEIGGKVVWHQDQTYLFTSPNPAIGLWIAIDDATVENGCLWAIPKGHKEPLRSRFIREGLKQRTEVLNESPWNIQAKIPLEVPRGSVIVLHGLLPHMSEANLSKKPRQAYTLHLMQKDWHYAKDNWLQRPEDNPFTNF